MFAHKMADGALQTIDVYARPMAHPHQLRIAAIIFAVMAVGCIYTAVFSTRSWNQKMPITTAMGFGFGAIACVLAGVVVLS